MSLLELLEKLAALVPLPRVHLVRFGGCLAPHSKLRDAIIPALRQQGVDGDETKTGPPYRSWARLLGRVFDLDMGTCPFCRRGSLRIIAAITQEAVMTRLLRHLKPASVPPPIAPARCRQEICAFEAAPSTSGSGARLPGTGWAHAGSRWQRPFEFPILCRHRFMPGDQ
jgi:hypothetical protein